MPPGQLPSTRRVSEPLVGAREDLLNLLHAGDISTVLIGRVHHMVLRQGFRAFFQCPPDRFAGQGVDELEFGGFVGQQAQGPAISTLWRCRAGQPSEVRFNPAIDSWRHRRHAARLSQQRGFGSIDNYRRIMCRPADHFLLENHDVTRHQSMGQDKWSPAGALL